MRARLYDAHCLPDGAMRGHQDHCGFGTAATHRAEHREIVRRGDVHVGEDDGEVPVRECPERFRPVSRRLHRVAVETDGHREGRPCSVVIVHDENRRPRATARHTRR